MDGWMMDGWIKSEWPLLYCIVSHIVSNFMETLSWFVRVDEIKNAEKNNMAVLRGNIRIATVEVLTRVSTITPKRMH